VDRQATKPDDSFFLPCLSHSALPFKTQHVLPSAALSAMISLIRYRDIS
jgi:hypothetical protein